MLGAEALRGLGASTVALGTQPPRKEVQTIRLEREAPWRERPCKTAGWGWERAYMRKMGQPGQLPVPSHVNEAILNSLESFELSQPSPRGTEIDMQAELNASQFILFSRVRLFVIPWTVA